MSHQVLRLIQHLPPELIVIGLALLVLAFLRHRNPFALALSLVKTAVIIALLCGVYFVRPDVYCAAHRGVCSVVKIVKSWTIDVAGGIERKVRAAADVSSVGDAQ